MDSDNQQERLDVNWVVGFVDGEGCFYVGINHPRGYIQVLPEFRIVQHKKDVRILHKLRNFFGFGSVTKNHGDGMELRVRGLANLNNLVAFFRVNRLETIKRNSFEKFATIISLMNERKHLTSEGVQTICNLAGQMNRQQKRRLESSETVRQTRNVMIQSDPGSDVRRSTEMLARLR